MPRKKQQNQTFYKGKELDMFAKWLALSPILRLLSKETLEKMGIDDPEELELIKIKTRQELAKKLGVHRSTLYEWQNTEELWAKVNKYKKEWGKKKTPSVLLGFYRKAISEADAARVRLWLEFFEDWKSKSEISLNENIKVEEENLDKIIEKLTEFLEKKYKK